MLYRTITSFPRGTQSIPALNQFILPPKRLASCVAGCIIRDTRSVELSEADRMNYFPATPLFTVTLTFSGAIHLSDEILGLDELRLIPKAPSRLYQVPKSRPQASWSPGPIWAATIAFLESGSSTRAMTTKPSAKQNSQQRLDGRSYFRACELRTIDNDFETDLKFSFVKSALSRPWSKICFQPPFSPE